MNKIIESGSNTIFTVDIMRRLGVQHHDLALPENQMRFSEVVRYLEKHPEPSLFISRAKMLNSATSSVDRLRYLSEYVHLHTKKAQLEGEMKNLSEEISLYER